MKKKYIKLNLPIFLKPKKNYLLERIGKDNDGGYLVCPRSIKETSSLISLGINDDWSFEEDFLKKNKNIHVSYFDPGTSFLYLTKIFFKKLFFFFYYKPLEIIKSFFQLLKFFLIKKKIYNIYISHGDILKYTKKVKAPFFLKIDIEGSEYRILRDIIKIKKKISGLVIEFHNTDLFIDNIKYFIKNIGLKLIHTHANNTLEHVTKTNILELTFSKNPIILNKDIKFPHILDQKNSIKNEEIKINFIR
jgi:hypothetical protein